MVNLTLKLFSLIIGIFIFVSIFFFFNLDFEKFIQTMKGANIKLVFLSFIIFLFYFPVYSYRVHLFTKCMGVSSFKKVSYITFASLALNYITPFKLGIPGKIYLFNRHFDLSYTKNILITFMELFTDIITFSIISFIGIFFIIKDTNYILPLVLILFLLISSLPALNILNFQVNI